MTDGASTLVDGVQWTLTPAGRALLSDADLRLDAHRATGRADVVKHGDRRSVYRVTLPTGAVYWKHSRVDGLRAFWRDFARGPKARLEFDRARELAARGIGTAEPLAWGRPQGFWPAGSALITRAVDDAVPMDEFLARHTAAGLAERREFTAALADYVARLHAAGARHPDLHPGNLLVRRTNGRVEFFLIDLHDLKLGPPLRRRARVANLVLLNRWFRMRSSRADRHRFWRAYAQAAGASDDAKRIERATDRSVADLWASRDVRCLRENRHFRRLRGPTATGFAVRDLPAELADRLLADPDGPFHSPSGSLLKDSRSATVCRLNIETPAGPRPMVYKRFRVTHWFDPIAHLFRASAALRSWTNGHALLARGLPTPRPWLMLHRRRLGFSTVGYVLTEFVPDARHLNEAVQAVSWREKRRLVAALGRWVRLMHGRGVMHRDLKAANILVTPAGECRFIDLVGMRTRASISPRRRVRDLTRLNASFVECPHVSRADRLRFLRVYLNWGLGGRAGWKDWWTAVRQGTEAKVRQNARRNRPLA
jgi:tRNA A-37 threonylcarbamoyl transferase component Bud32